MIFNGDATNKVGWAPDPVIFVGLKFYLKGLEP